MSALARPSLTVFSGAGLCNRLMVLVSGRVLAEAAGRAFSMLWPRTAACGAGFHELFASGWPVTDLTRLERSVWRLHVRGRETPLPDPLHDPRPEIVLGHSYWLLRPTTFPEHAGLVARCAEVLARLEPRADLEARIRAFQTRHFRPAMIGLHLRRGDYLSRHPEVCGNTSAAMTAVDQLLGRMPDAGILLCTDDGAPDPRGGMTPSEGVREAVRRRYGTRVVETQPRSLDRFTPEAIQDAVVDLLLLRATQAFVGTSVSSFSELATFGRAVPRVRVGAALVQSP